MPKINKNFYATKNLYMNIIFLLPPQIQGLSIFKKSLCKMPSYNGKINGFSMSAGPFVS